MKQDDRVTPGGCIGSSPGRLGTSPDHDSADTALLCRARMGGYVGAQARTRLVQRYYAWIKKRCLQTLGNDAEANDATQEVALRMYRALPDFEGRSSLRTWLNTIVHNECVSVIRKRQRVMLTAHLESLIVLYECDQRISQSSLDFPRNAVREALDALPSQAKEVLQLRFYSELSLTEIGGLLGISLSAAKMRLYRAMDELKEIYQQFNGDEPVFT